MWIFLAIAVFLAGQGYLFFCLRKLDTFLVRQESQPEREVLSLVFADSEILQQMTPLMEGFFRAHPEVDIVLHTDPAVSEAVHDGRGDIGFSQSGMVCNPFGQSDCARAFVDYLWQASRNPRKSVV